MIQQYQQVLIDRFGAPAIAAAKDHARAEFPKESCGFISKGRYFACKNAHPEPTEHFMIDDDRYYRAVVADDVDAVIHSHPNGPAFPSELDMQQQVLSGLPWIILTLNEDTFGSSIAWGDDLPVAPLIGRPFVHGVFDCYSALRDTFRLGRDELLKQDIHWPLPPILLPEVPRDDAWWQKGDDLYVAHFEKFGFRKISFEEARPGDVFLSILGDRRANPQRRINHAGVLLEHDQVLQHLPIRLSGRMPAGLWGRAAEMWIRHEVNT